MVKARNSLPAGASEVKSMTSRCRSSRVLLGVAALANVKVVSRRGSRHGVEAEIPLHPSTADAASVHVDSLLMRVGNFNRETNDVHTTRNVRVRRYTYSWFSIALLRQRSTPIPVVIGKSATLLFLQVVEPAFPL